MQKPLFPNAETVSDPDLHGLMGHKEGGLFTRYAGTEGPEFELLKATIEKVRYPGLKL